MTVAATQTPTPATLTATSSNSAAAKPAPATPTVQMPTSSAMRRWATRAVIPEGVLPASCVSSVCLPARVPSPPSLLQLLLLSSHNHSLMRLLASHSTPQTANQRRQCPTLRSRRSGPARGRQGRMPGLLLRRGRGRQKCVLHRRRRQRQSLRRRLRLPGRRVLRRQHWRFLCSGPVLYFYFCPRVVTRRILLVWQNLFVAG
jgi:hypothetical protein